MKTRHYVRGYVQRAADDAGDEGKPLTIVAATAGRKADGLNLTMDGAELGRFESNPVLGYGHNYWGRESLPIGRADRTWIDGDRMMMDLEFDQDDDFAVKVERKYRNRYMNAFSIGFDAWDIDDSGTPSGWELFEVSAVPLPMDPDAVVEAGRADQLALARALAAVPAGTALSAELLGAGGRAGAVLSKANKKLVTDALAALQALLDAAGGDQDDDDARARAGAPAGAPVDRGRLLRLAGIR